MQNHASCKFPSGSARNSYQVTNPQYFSLWLTVRNDVCLQIRYTTRIQHSCSNTTNFDNLNVVWRPFS